MVDMLTFEPIPVNYVVERGTQKTVLQITIPQSTFVSLDIDGNYSTLYLTPGDNLHAYINDLSPEKSLRFEGSGAEVNSYLVRANIIRVQAEQPKGNAYFTLSTQEFLAHLKTVNQSYQRLNQCYLTKSKLPDSLKTVLVKRNQINLLFLKQNYVLAHDSESSDKLPASLTDEVLAIPFDPHFITWKLPEYAMVVNIYVGFALPKHLSNQVTTAGQMPLLIEKLIQSSNRSSFSKEFLLAKNCYNWLALSGITPETDSIFVRYKDQFPQSVYLSGISQLYNKWLRLSPGQPAPDFFGVTPKGDTLALSSLRGKVVYVDVWATWCAPCRAEFPQSKALQAQFASNPNMVFLYVSVDQDQAAWKRLLLEDQPVGGIHINQASDSQAGSLWKPYLLTGIPRYMLIDQNGLLVNVNADRPTSGKLTSVFEKLLK